MPRRTSRPPDRSAYDTAIGLIARRDHSRSEIRIKLLRCGYPEAAIDDAEARLSAAGLLNDAAFARMYVRRRSRTRGSLVISAELSAKGIDREIADAALGRVAPQAQMLAAYRTARRLAGNTEFASYKELLHSVGVKLLRRGFSMHQAREACDYIWGGTEDAPDPFEE